MALYDWLYDRFNTVYNYLDWGTPIVDPLVNVVEDTLELYGVTLEADATDEKKLHAIAKYKLWERVLNDVVADYKFSADNASYDRNQVYEMAKKNLEAAVVEASFYISGGIQVGTIGDFAGINPQTVIDTLNYWDRRFTV